MTPLTLAITTYQRYQMTLESFADVVNHPRIDQILILDDSSPKEIVDKIRDSTKAVDKVKLYTQVNNRGMMQNKADAIIFAKNEWVIIFDSDNVLTNEYINAIPATLNPNTIYVPSFAKPLFDMRPLEGKLIDKDNAKFFADLPCFGWFLNVCNYVVNQNSYMKEYRFAADIKGTDTAYFALNWLRAGKSFYVVPGMHYFHKVHDGSEFMKDISYNMTKANEILKQIKQL